MAFPSVKQTLNIYKQQYIAATLCKLIDINANGLCMAVVTQKSNRHTECNLPTISLEMSRCLIKKLPIAKYPNIWLNLGYQSFNRCKTGLSQTLHIKKTSA